MQPVGGARPVELRIGSICELLGEGFDSDDMERNAEAARRCLDEAAARGLFSLERESEYLLESHCASPEDWADFADRPKAGRLEVGEEDLSRALATLARGEGRLVVTETVSARAYLRL